MAADDTDHAHLAAALLSFNAHALRNHVATLRSVVQLIDDPEIAEATAVATSAIQVDLERAVVLARAELGDRPAVVDLASAELVRLAVERTRREGGFDFRGVGESLRGTVTVPGAWVERLVADLLHHADGAPRVFEDDDAVVIDVPLHAPPNVALAPAMRRIAAECGCALDLAHDRAVLRLPLSAG